MAYTLLNLAMRVRSEIPIQTVPRDVFVARLQLLKSRSEADRGELTRTREAIARRTDKPDLLQLSETMKEIGIRLGQERADAAWLRALRDQFPHDYTTIIDVWRQMQQVRQEMDQDPSEDRGQATPTSGR